MSNGFVGMDVAAARSMAADLETWPGQAREVVTLVTEAEMLSDLPTGVTAMLDQVGADAATMASRIRRSADALESFTIDLSSPRLIAAAVADVKAFRGSDNDPELDRRLGVLRELIEAETSSDDDAARVMAAVLAAERSIHIGYRDLDDVVHALEVVDDLSEAAARGAVSANDPHIDDAVAALRDALDVHSSSDAQTDAFLAALLRGDREHDVATLLGATLSGYSVDVVRVADHNDLDYDVADGVIKMHEVDRLSAAIGTAPLPEIAALEQRRRELLIEIAGSDDSLVIDSLTELISNEMSTFEAFSGIEAHVAEVVHNQQVAAVARDFDLDSNAAETLLNEMSESTLELAGAGIAVEDAAAATNLAAKFGLDISEVDPATLGEEFTLVELVATADALAMSISEYQTFRGLAEFFEPLDAAIDGEPDGIVSLADLEHVVANPAGHDPRMVAVAAALIASPALRHRLDRGRDHGDVVGSDPFGSAESHDEKISSDDMAGFEAKQLTNHVLQPVLELIDVAAQGGDVSLADRKFSEADFEAVLAQADELGLTGNQIAAVENVLQYDWYDKTFWQEHGDDVILAAAVVAGMVIFASSMGTATAAGAAVIQATLTATAASTIGGSLVASGITIGENLLTGDDWNEDLSENMVTGGVGGLGGAGWAGAGTVSGAAPLSVRVVNALGFGADTAGLAAAGLFDPLLDPVYDDAELEDFKNTSQTVSYLTAGASLGLAGVSSVGARAGANSSGNAAGATKPAPNYANYGGEMFDDGMAGVASRLELSPAHAARAAEATAEAAARAAHVESLQDAAQMLDGGAVVQAAQRVTGVGFDRFDFDEVAVEAESED